jgi:hypothetical protein
MTSFSKLLLKILTVGLIVVLFALLIALLGRQQTPIQVLGATVTMYGTIILFYLFLLHVVVVLVSYFKVKRPQQ